MELIKVEQIAPAQLVGWTSISPKELNALNPQLMGELRDALQQLDKNDNVRVDYPHRNQQAFAAGADINRWPTKVPSICWWLISSVHG